MGMKPSETNENFSDAPDGWDELEWFHRIQHQSLRADSGRPMLTPDHMNEFSPALGDQIFFRTVYDKFSAGLVKSEKTGPEPGSESDAESDGDSGAGQ